MRLPNGFAGRNSELALLDKRLAGIAAGRTGTALVIRGRATAGAPLLPGFDPGETALIGVSPTGFTDAAAAHLALRWLPEDVIRAFA